MSEPILRRLSTDELGADRVATIRALMTAAFGDDPEDRFEDADWDHALGGVHVVLEEDGLVLAHAAVVERTIQIGRVPVRTGYVEAVATEPARQGSGLGTRVMQDIGVIIQEGFELGVLGTGRQRFYERLGWRTWRGPSGYRDADAGLIHWTPDDDGFLMVLRTPSSPRLEDGASIVCAWRPGDVW